MEHITSITAAYNAEKWVSQSILSMAEQEYKNKSIVIIDDKSRDKTVDVVIELFDKAPVKTTLKDKEEAVVYQGRIRDVQAALICLKKNGRQGRARNVGIRYAWNTADAFKILDADDYLEQGCIDEHARAWRRNKGVIGGVYSDYYIRDDRTGIITREYKESYSRDRLMQECIVSSGALLSKEAIGRAGLFDEEVSPVEDYGIFLKISHSHIFYHIPKPLWTYRLHGANATVADLDKHRAAFPIMVENYKKWCQNPVGYNG